MTAPSIAGVLDDFNAAFNRNDLDAVMTFFADTARYEPGDGTIHVGRDAIRRAFDPQFRGAFGTMRFDTEDRVIDERERKAAIRWICRHDTRGDHGKHVPLPLRAVLKLRYGGQVQWRGLDVFHLDGANKIICKFTYAGYKRPRLERI